MLRIYTTGIFLLLGLNSIAQIFTDTLSAKILDEVIVIAPKKQLNEKQFKSLATLDEYLQSGGKVNLVRRGAYAWEPQINNMSTERTVVTIDGMRIFGACTDKMDPVTSYVEVSNLAEASVCSGQQGSCYGATIGGALDLKRNSTDFKPKGWDLSLNHGLEANNIHQVAGASATYTDKSYNIDTDLTFREAHNYFDGKGHEIDHSGFKKINFSNALGWKFNNNQFIETSVIFDRATQVGYPALPMDVSLAQALITSIKYVAVWPKAAYKKFEVKLYYNTITHRMDDTTRPEVPIHMDMPGWSNTSGFYAQLERTKAQHHWLLNVNSFYNQSLAEMTMYPKNPQENKMFMYTWPDVRTFYSGLFLQDNWTLNCHTELKLTTSVGLHQNTVASPFGLSSLQIFYPEMPAQKNRWLKSLGVQYRQTHELFEWSLGGAYSERAPSVSEGYGFYLFNSSDRFDYIGNPNLKTESAFELNVSCGYKTPKLYLKLNSNAFHIQDYIIGQPNTNFIPMTIGATGVKWYRALTYARLFNLDFTAQYKVTAHFLCTAQVKYSAGQDHQNQNLPLIQPLAYHLSLTWNYQKFSVALDASGNATQNHYGQTYGEQKTDDFSIYNLNTSYQFKWKQAQLLIKLGVENLTDKYYTTYSDWNKIPRMGRNVFINLTTHLF